MCVTSVSCIRLLSLSFAAFTTTACASIATPCAIMDLSEAGDTGSGSEDENCSSAIGSSLNHLDQFCTQQPLFGFIELGGFRQCCFVCLLYFS